MSLVVFVVVTLGLAGLAIALRGRQRWAISTAMAGLVLAVVAAIAIDPAQTVAIGDGGLVAGAYLRLFLILGSIVALGLTIAGLAAGTQRDAPAVTLAMLGATALTLALVDPRAAVLAATAGGLFGVLVALGTEDRRVGATVGILEIRAVAVSGALAIAATAWLGRDLSHLEATTVVFGLAYLAFPVAVAMRFGAIPFHLWAARLTDVVPETALPILTVLAPASLAVVALAWLDASVVPLALNLAPERGIVLAIAIASIWLAAVAAVVQDDVEHILGYSIVADAGVIVLALAALTPEAAAPARTWILAFVVARAALAAWTAGIRAGFLTGRVADLHGWARRSPILAVGFGLMMLATVGLPGFASFDARASVVGLALFEPVTTIVRIATLAPILYYGRLLVIGLLPPDRIGEPVNPWRPRVARPDVTAVRRWLRVTWLANMAFTTASIGLLLGALALATAVGGFGGPTAAAAPPPTISRTGASPASTPSSSPSANAPASASSSPAPLSSASAAP
ncbi:MAG: proton-conducting transporter membrane subunit [Chloroflexota bacterium]